MEESASAKDHHLPVSLSNSPISPRPVPRPSGPRSQRPNYKSAVSPTLNLQGSPTDEAVPAYSGRNSPISQADSRPQSPFMARMPSLSQLSETMYGYTHSKSPLRREQSVQTIPSETAMILAATSTTPPLPGLATATPKSGSRSSTPAVKALLKPPTLDLPPPLDFEPVQVPWRGLTLEAAQWTFSSEQLQDIVSKAIRMSAQEGFIKLLSLKTLDEELVEELQRLDMLKATTQSQYRFNLHRRTMLLQSLLAVSANPDADSSAIINLTTQLAEITVSCDRLMENMVRIVDQRSQIQHLQVAHTSSALAMALRKLNGSYARRTSELKEAREQADQLKAELEEAWNIAQDMAEEMDDLDNFHSGFSSDEDEDEDMSGSLNVNRESAGGDTLGGISVQLAQVVGVTGTAVVRKATITRANGQPLSDPTNTSTERTLNAPERETDRTRRVSAAKRRSSRTSKASLRMPKTPTTDTCSTDRVSISSKRSRSKSLRGCRGSPDDSSVPPIPNHPKEPPTSLTDSFLEMSETRPGSPAQGAADLAPPVPPLQLANEDAMVSPPIDTPHVEDPIRLHYAEGSGRPSFPVRRVKSVQPPPTRNRRSLDDSEIDAAQKRASKFDGWPWLMGEKRRSVPLRRASLDSAKKAMAEKAMSSLKKDVDDGALASAEAAPNSISASGCKEKEKS